MFIAMVLFPLVTFAQRSGIVPCGPEEGGSGGEGNVSGCELNDLFGLLVGIYNFLLGMAGIVAFGFLIYGGIQILLYSTSEENLKAGKSTVIQALIGLAIIALAYIVVNTLLSVLGVSDDYLGSNLLGN